MMHYLKLKKIVQKGVSTHNRVKPFLMDLVFKFFVFVNVSNIYFVQIKVQKDIKTNKLATPSKKDFTQLRNGSEFR